MKQILRIMRRILFIIIGKDILYFKQIKCKQEQHGSKYGGWIICPNSIDENNIIYSFGIGTDISFELSLIKKYNTEVHSFDPTPKVIKWVKSQELPKQFILHEFGLAEYDGNIKFFPPDNPNYISQQAICHPRYDLSSIT